MVQGYWNRCKNSKTIRYRRLLKWIRNAFLILSLNKLKSSLTGVDESKGYVRLKKRANDIKMDSLKGSVMIRWYLLFASKYFGSEQKMSMEQLNLSMLRRTSIFLHGAFHRWIEGYLVSLFFSSTSLATRSDINTSGWAWASFSDFVLHSNWTQKRKNKITPNQKMHRIKTWARFSFPAGDGSWEAALRLNSESYSRNQP